MSAFHIRSPALASAFGITLLTAVLTGSAIPVPDEAGSKGDLRVVASGCRDGCSASLSRLTHYDTRVDVDRANGIITLERERLAD